MNIKILSRMKHILIAMCVLMIFSGLVAGFGVKTTQAQPVIWKADIEQDADENCIKTNVDGEIDGCTLRKIVTSNVNNFGLTNWAAHIDRDNLLLNQCMKIEFVVPVNTEEFKSLDIKYRYGAGACFYIYPLSATELNYENAVQSFRTTKSVDSFTLSTDLISENNTVNGFIVQHRAGTEQKQFFIDSVTPRTATYTPEKVEDLRPFQWVNGEKTDTNGEVMLAMPAGSLGEYTSPIISIDNLGDKYPEWGMTGFVTFGATSLEVNQFIKFEFKVPMDITKTRSFEIEYKFTRDGYFYIYPISETNLVYENAVQGFLSESGVKKLTLSSEKLGENGECKGFIIQLKEFDGDPHQFFLDSITPSEKAYTPGKVDDLKPFDWQDGVEFDVNKEVIQPTSKSEGNIGEYEPLTVYLENLDNFGITGYGAFCSDNLKQGQFLRYKFVKPVNTSEFKSAELKIMHNSPACFYIFPLNVTELTRETAVQSFRTQGDIETLAISMEKLAVDNVCNGFIIQLKTEAGVQFFIDSITVKKEVYNPGEVEDLRPFEWQENVKYDADPTIFRPSHSEQFEEYNSMPVSIENLSKFNIGIEDYGTFSVEAIKKGQFLVFRFVNGIDAEIYKSFTIEFIHNSSACYYVYPLTPLTMEYEGAVQSFRTSGQGLQSVTMSSENLSENGLVNGFIIQLRTEEGAQFLIDNITVSKKSYEPGKVEEIFEPEWTESEVRITAITLVHEYETGAGQDMLKIQFNRNIFSKNNEMLMNLEYLDNYLMINGKTLKQAGIGVYALRGVFSQKSQVAIFLLNNKENSLKNDGYDKIEIKTGFAIQGSGEDYTLYTVKIDSVWYSNTEARDGEAIQLSTKFNPPAKVNNSLSATITGGENTTITLVFEKEISGLKSNEILESIKVNGKLLKDIEGVKVNSNGNKLIIQTKKLAGQQSVTVMKGLKLGESVVTEDVTYRKVYDDEDIMFNTDNESLIPYWIYEYKVLDNTAEFTVHTSEININTEDFISKSLEKIVIDGVKFTEIENAHLKIMGSNLKITLPKEIIKDKTTITFEKGFMLPSGKIGKTTTYIFDEIFGEFFIKKDTESIKDRLKTTDIVGVLRGVDGVKEGTNELFVEFSTPVSHKYLPYTQADAQTIYTTYGLSEVTISELYIYELSLYGIRESLYDNILLDGKSIRDYAINDREKGGEWKRFIDCYYLGNIFNDYTMQIAIGSNSSAVMDWTKEHTVTFRKGFITPTLCVLDKDQTFRWDTESSKWYMDTRGMATVDGETHLKPDNTENQTGCNGSISEQCGMVGIVLAVLSIVVLWRRKDA